MGPACALGRVGFALAPAPVPRAGSQRLGFRRWMLMSATWDKCLFVPFKGYIHFNVHRL